jgi:alpha-N-arabinofuranosidase
VVERPKLPRAPRPAQPLSGDYAFKDDFTSRKLGFGWMGVRIPAVAPYSLEHGDLVLKAGPEGLGDIHHVPAFVGRKQAHAIATVTTELRYTADRPGDRAGLVAMQSDDAYLFLGVRQENGRQVVTLSVRRNAQDPQEGRVLASAPLASAAGRARKQIYLKLDIDGGVLGASYAVRKDQWKSLATSVDATFLSTRLAGGFVGTVIGLYNEQAPYRDSQE